ncbi:MAG: flagellar motor protein MotB [Candidatus Gastranaerophilaceae bacterium]
MKSRVTIGLFCIFFIMFFQPYYVKSIESETPNTNPNSEINHSAKKLFIDNSILKNIISCEETNRGLVISFDANIFFENGDDEIKENSKIYLDEIGKILKIIDKFCIIESNVKIANTEGYTNWELSTLQAQKISEYLINVHQLDQQKIRAIGFGSILPKNLNPRIDFVILNY